METHGAAPSRVVLEDQPGEFSYPAVIQTNDGLVPIESRVHQAPLADLGVEIFAEGGTVVLLSLDARDMAPTQITHSRLLE